MNEYTTELMHHGVQGMRWGIRRYQPYGAGYDPQKMGKFIGNMKRTSRGYQKALNRLSKDAEYNQAFGQEHDKKQEKYTKKSNEYFKRMRESSSAHAKKKFEKKSMKYARKALEERNKRDSYNKLVKESDEMVNKIIGDAATHNFDITQKMDRKLVDTGNNALRVLASVLLGPVPGTVATYRTQEVDSNRYKVTKNTDPSRNVGNLTYMITPERVLENNNRGADRVAKAVGDRKQAMEQAKEKSTERQTTTHEDAGNYMNKVAKAMQTNKAKIQSEAPKYYVEQNYEMLSKIPQLQGKSKAEITKLFKVGNVNNNGIASLEPQGPIANLMMFPYVEYGIDKVGKLKAARSATDS